MPHESPPPNALPLVVGRKGTSSHPAPNDHQLDEIESCAVIDPLDSKKTLRSPTLIGEASSKSSLDLSKEKEVAICEGLVEGPSSGNMMVPLPPLCEAISAVEDPCNCPCAGEVLVPSGGEVSEQVVPAKDGSWLQTLPRLSEEDVGIVPPGYTTDADIAKTAYLEPAHANVLLFLKIVC
ncbi:hypothetical protein Nepgr_028947 [Nepenthes gracilis]|uniref:Uncharacterized protein n=1 Tax=Nepenthes gracilis TaxID=150966 RepID=A0AAD3Y4J4_NEPGR|nr:hypothetical protein Nepgr_028947 [Nepenthes gracilis]